MVVASVDEMVVHLVAWRVAKMVDSEVTMVAW